MHLAEDAAAGDPLLARLLSASAAGVPPAGRAQKRAPIRITVDPLARPERKGRLCAQDCAFNLHAATRVPAKDGAGREALQTLRYEDFQQ